MRSVDKIRYEEELQRVAEERKLRKYIVCGLKTN